MNYIQITENNKNTIKGNLTNDKNTLNIPVKFIGTGILNFTENDVNVNPEIVNVIKNKNVINCMKNVKINDIFGKNVIEGIDSNNNYSVVMVDSSEIKEMWTDNYNGIWNIEV